MPATSDDRLRADCAQCVALCCVAPAFARSADFAIDKPAGRACPNLRDDCACGIHDRLRERGFPGCTVFDCFGAGQHVTQHTFGGASWRDADVDAQLMFDAFGAMRALHELRWYLTQATELGGDAGLVAAARDELGRVEQLTQLAPAGLALLDVDEVRDRANAVLQAASAAARAPYGPSAPDHRGAMLAGAGFAGADLRGANLRGAVLVGADLARADLTGADVTGADLRGAELAGARLDGCHFLTRMQLVAANGDRGTTIPAGFDRPAHWRD